MKTITRFSALSMFLCGAACGSVVDVEADAGDEGQRDAAPDAGDPPSEDAASADAGVAPRFRLPDSQTPFCTDGAEEVDCPTSGDLQGQDGDYRLHVPDYELEANDALVFDTVSRLRWTRLPNAALTPEEAEAYCGDVADNQIGGRDDWRLPTRFELSTLFDLGRDEAAFPAVFSELELQHALWTATPYAGDSTQYWLARGNGNFETFEPGDHGFEPRILCVSGDVPAAELEDLEGEALLDERTGLVWEQGVSDDLPSWGDALARCEALSLAGHDDWRLPSAKEYQSIVDDTATDPAFPGEFEDHPDGDELWTSTPLPQAPERARVIDASSSAQNESPLDEAAAARCVRGPDDL